MDLSAGPITIKAPSLTALNNFEIGATENNDFFSIQPNGAFGFDAHQSSLAFIGGTAADALGLTQAVGAFDSSPGGLHVSVGTFMNSVLTDVNQLGATVPFTSVQTNDTRIAAGLSTWAAANGITYV